MDEFAKIVGYVVIGLVIVFLVFFLKNLIIDALETRKCTKAFNEMMERRAKH